MPEEQRLPVSTASLLCFPALHSSTKNKPPTPSPLREPTCQISSISVRC
jgi:hypothetical protein